MAFQDLYGSSCTVNIANPMDDKRVPSFIRGTQTDYDKVVARVPDLYSLGYSATDFTVTTGIMESAMSMVLSDPIHDLIQQYRPDAVVTAYPFYQAPLVTLLSGRHRFTPVYTVVTDLVSLHRIWFNRGVTGCFVPTEAAAALALAAGIPEDRIYLTGIPVNPAIALESRGPQALRVELGWDPDLPTILAVSSARVEHMLESLMVINHLGFPLQLVVVAGGDDRLYQAAQSMEWHVPAYVYNYVDNLPAMMHASDVVLCKAGGLIVTESLASGLPLILIHAIPGQETGNAQYVVENGAGDLVQNSLQLVEAVAHLLLDGQRLLAERKATAKSLGRPMAAFDIARTIWRAVTNPELAQEYALSRKGHKDRSSREKRARRKGPSSRRRAEA